MTTVDWIQASIFASLFVAFIVAVVGLLWKQSGIPVRVERLEGMMDRLMAESKRVPALTEQVRGLSERVGREARRNTTEHKALAEGMQAVTGHLLDIKKMSRATR